jgi:hypothetical protein
MEAGDYISGRPDKHENNTRVEAGSNSSTVAPRVVGGDEKGTQYLGVYPGVPLSEGYKCGDLFLKVGGVSNLRQ